jgi:hypothetical protein
MGLKKGACQVVETLRPRVLSVLAVMVLAGSGSAGQSLRGLTAMRPAQASGSATICGTVVSPPGTLPPTTQPAVVYLVAPCFQSQGGLSFVGAETYLRNIQLRPSRPAQGLWVPYDATADKVILEDFQRLWGSNALDDLSVDIRDYAFPNGVVGKLVTYNITERH